MSTPRFFVGAISQRSATVTATIRLFFSPTRHLTRFGGIALLPHRSNKREQACCDHRGAIAVARRERAGFATKLSG
jgi:hypothetical protein